MSLGGEAGLAMCACLCPEQQKLPSLLGSFAVV
jgi:hypothetical protein